MMLDKDIQATIAANTERSPIWYGSIKYHILIKRKWIPFEASKIVMKGTIKQILADERIKRRVLDKYFGDDKASKKKAHDFDLDKIKLVKPIIYKFLTYANKQG